MSFSQITAFPNGISSFGIPQLSGGLLPFPGNYFFVNPATGADGNTGSADSPLSTLAAAYGRCQDNHDDVVFLVGSTTNTHRLAATLVWAKNNTHLVGLSAPTQVGQRARISNLAAAFFSPLVQVTAAGCMFLNFSTFIGFVAPATQVAWQDSGQRNYYGNVDLSSFGSTQSAGDTGSRSLLLDGVGLGESTFEHCYFGVDTITRGVQNANLEFQNGNTRNTFRDCTFAMDASAATPVAILCAAAASIDRWNMFERCRFINAIGSGATAMTGAAKLVASAGGILLFDSCSLVGISSFAYDAASKAQIYMANTPVPDPGVHAGEAINPA